MIIQKLRLQLTASFEALLPEGAEILCVQVQDGIPTVWYSFDERRTLAESRLFRILTTGSVETLSLSFKYLGSFQLHGGSFVGHVYYEEKEYGLK